MATRAWPGCARERERAATSDRFIFARQEFRTRILERTTRYAARSRAEPRLQCTGALLRDSRAVGDASVQQMAAPRSGREQEARAASEIHRDTHSA